MQANLLHFASQPGSKPNIFRNIIIFSLHYVIHRVFPCKMSSLSRQLTISPALAAKEIQKNNTTLDKSIEAPTLVRAGRVYLMPSASSSLSHIQMKDTVAFNVKWQ